MGEGNSVGCVLTVKANCGPDCLPSVKKEAHSLVCACFDKGAHSWGRVRSSLLLLLPQGWGSLVLLVHLGQGQDAGKCADAEKSSGMAAHSFHTKASCQLPSTPSAHQLKASHLLAAPAPGPLLIPPPVPSQSTQRDCGRFCGLPPIPVFPSSLLIGPLLKNPLL